MATCDVDLKRAKELNLSADGDVFDDIDVMLNNIKGIDDFGLFPPNGLHAEHSIKALESGHHVLCEKPMAITSQDCTRMIQAAERNNRRLFVVTEQVQSSCCCSKKLIDEGKLGRY